MANFKIEPNASWGEQGQKSAQKKSQIKTNSKDNISAGVGTNGQTVQEVTSLKYQGATLYKEGTCSAELRMKIASAMTMIATLNRICRSKTVSFASKFKLCPFCPL